MSDQKTRSVTVVQLNSYDLPNKLNEFIEVLNEDASNIPEMFRDTAEIELDSDYDTSAITFIIRYYRPETADERQVRLDREEAVRTGVIDRERKEFERLKAKFGA